MRLTVLPAAVPSLAGLTRREELLGDCGDRRHGPSRKVEVARNQPPAASSTAGVFSPRTLNVGTGFENPLNGSSPMGSARASVSTAPRRRWETRIWPGLAAPQRRAARLVTVPMAP